MELRFELPTSTPASTLDVVLFPTTMLSFEPASRWIPSWLADVELRITCVWSELKSEMPVSVFWNTVRFWTRFELALARLPPAWNREIEPFLIVTFAYPPFDTPEPFPVPVIECPFKSRVIFGAAITR